MKKIMKKHRVTLRKLGWFGRLAEKHGKSEKPLEPGVAAIGMAVEDFQKNRTRAAVMERDVTIPEPVKEELKGKESWSPTKVCCPKCGSDRLFETASGKKCLNQNCGAVFDLRTEIQLA